MTEQDVEAGGFAASDRGQGIYNLCREHGLTLTEWADLHPADKRFLRVGATEYGLRREQENDEPG